MNFLVHGSAGRMGLQIIIAIQKAGHTVACGVDSFYASAPSEETDFPCFSNLDAVNVDFDCIIDFSNHTATLPLLEFAKQRKAPVMLATTGHTDEEKEAIIEASKEIPIFRAANMSLGIATLCRLVKTATAMFPDANIEIVEQHHNQKLDVPSGTALALFEAVKEARPSATPLVGRNAYGKRTQEEVGIHSLRLGNVVGIHEVIITTGNETLTLKHEAHSRAVFADGAVLAAAYLGGKMQNGVTSGIFTMEDLINESLK